MGIAKGPQKGLKDQMGQKGQKGQALLQRARFERFGSQRAKKGSPVSGDSDGHLGICVATIWLANTLIVE